MVGAKKTRLGVATFRNELIQYLGAMPSAGDDNQFVGCCPAHGDTEPSLAMRFVPGKKNPILHCFAGCEFHEIREACVELEMWDFGEDFVDSNVVPGGKDKIEVAEIRSAAKKEFRPPPLSNINGTPAELYLKNRGIKQKINNESLKYLATTYFVDRSKSDEGVKLKVPALWALLKNETDEVVGANKIYLTHSGKKAEFSKSKKIGGNVKGAAVKFGDKNSTRLHLTEGVETALAIFQATNEQVWATCSALNLSSQIIPETIDEIFIWADKDNSKAGEIQSQKAAIKFRGIGKKVSIKIPFLNEKDQPCDWLDVYNEDPGKISFELDMPDFEVTDVIGPSIQRFSDDEFFIPTLLPEMLPKTLRTFVFDNARRMGTSPESIAVFLISAIGSLIGRKLAVRPKKFDTWFEFGNLWGLVVAPPGRKKSPALQVVLGVVNEMQRILNKQTEAENSVNSGEIAKLDFQISELERKIKNKSSMEISLKINDLKLEKSKLEKISPRLFTNDGTVEKLQEIIISNPNGLLVIRDEMRGKFNEFNKQGRESEKQFYLESWSGMNPFRVDRMNRGSLDIPPVCLTLVGTIQPDVLAKLMSGPNSIAADGLIQRFQLMVIPNRLKKIEYIDEAPDFESEREVHALFKKLLNFETQVGRLSTTIAKNQICLGFDDEAQILFAQYYQDCSVRNEGSIGNSDFVNHLTKYSKLYPALSLIFFVTDWLSENTQATLMSVDHLRKAIEWTSFLEAHAKKVYGLSESTQRSKGQLLLEKIYQNKIEEGDSIREIYRHNWTGLGKSEDAFAAVEELVARNYISVQEKKSKNGGHPETIIFFHPDLSREIKK